MFIIFQSLIYFLTAPENSAQKKIYETRFKGEIEMPKIDLGQIGIETALEKIADGEKAAIFSGISPVAAMTDYYPCKVTIPSSTLLMDQVAPVGYGIYKV